MFTNILYVIENEFFGGGERAFAQLINGLDKDKYEVYVACLPRSSGLTPELFVEEIQGAAQIVPFDLRNQFNLWNIFRLIRIVKEKKIGLMHSQGARADFFARIAARLAKVPIMISTIAMPVEGYDVHLLKKIIYVFLDRFSERFVDRFIVVSEKLKKTLIYKHKINPEKVVTICNGIEVDEYKPNAKEVRSSREGHVAQRGRQESGVRREFALARDVPVIGAIGRLVWQKGFEYLIEAVPEVLKEYPDARFLIVGEGPLKDKLKVKSGELRVEDNVIFTGFRSDIKEILSAIDILVAPSLLEGFPMITLEAMAMAKPIIATNIDGITEQITDGIEGILIEPKSASAISEAVKHLVDNPDYARLLGRKAREKVVRDFSVHKMITETIKIYETL